jgi:hypothetical protein
MRGFTIACILGNNNSTTTTTNKLKRKNSDDDDNERQPNKRQTIEGKNKYLFHIISISFSIKTHSTYRIRLNQKTI